MSRSAGTVATRWSAALGLALVLSGLLAPATLADSAPPPAQIPSRPALPDTGSGITRDVGSIAVIEWDGSNYDKETTGGVANYAPRTAVAKRFYETHSDAYDFLVVFTNFEFQTGKAVAFHNFIRNDIRGIHKAIADDGREFGSPGRLKGYVDMTAIARYQAAPLSLELGAPGFRRSLNVLAHELGHQWLAEVRYLNAQGHESTDLLGQDLVHWSYLLDSQASVMYGSNWVARGDGTYLADRTEDGYSALDLYLMGLLDPAKVPPLTLLRSAAVDPNGIPVEGATVTAVPETVDVSQIVAVEGPRTPPVASSQKAFRLGFIFLTAPGVDPSASDLAAVDLVRQAFEGHFFALTRGVALADTTLAEAPAVPHAATPDLGKAMAWLLANQSPDGRWEDSISTPPRDTATALEAVLAAGEGGAPPYANGWTWLSNLSPTNTDYRARTAQALASGWSRPQRDAAAAGIRALQNPDGGFGVSRGFSSDALDTALALHALSALGQPFDAGVRAGVVALGAMQDASGGWPVVPGGEPSTVATAQVIEALQDWHQAAEAAPLLGRGLAALLARQNADGGFGESPSSDYATALALRALLRAGAPATPLTAATEWLRGTQRLDGSWGGSRYTTALVIATLNQSVLPNLVVRNVTAQPNPAGPNDDVTVSALIANVGRGDSVPCVASLLDGPPSGGARLGDAAIPALASGAQATVSFSLSAAGLNGSHALYVVADAANAVAESRKDDNALSVALMGPLPDYAVSGLGVAPNPPQEGETVEVSVSVANLGQAPAAATTVTLSDGDPRRGGVAIGRAPVPALAVGAVHTVAIPWNTTGALGAHTLSAVVNAGFSVAESDTSNDEAAFPVRVTGPLPPGPDLTLQSLKVSPASLTSIPETFQFTAVVGNVGRDPVDSTVALFNSVPPSGPPVGSLPVHIEGRSSTTLSFSATVSASGNSTFVAVADPDGEVVETDETNNQARVTILDLQGTVGLSLVATPSSGTLTVGDTLTVDVVVQNFGTARVEAIPLVLARSNGSSSNVLAETLVSVEAGVSTLATLTWKATVTGNPLPLVVRIDPQGLLPELPGARTAVDFGVTVQASPLTNVVVSGADISLEPDPPLEGHAGTISAKVRNTSPVDAGPFVMAFFLGDPASGGTEIGQASVQRLEAGAVSVVTIPWTPSRIRGNETVWVVADTDSQLSEYDTTDNRAFRALAIAGLPDLVLAPADVALTPPFPHAGEAVTIQATVHNLGAQRAPASVLRGVEGEAATGDGIGEAVVPPIGPGQAATVTLSWTPAAPVGARTLSLIADAEGVVAESDEGNNLVPLTVVIQDADLYLSAPYFSPNGDGVLDTTTLAYRATSPVDVVISDGLGRLVRTLAHAAPAEGALTWDGTDDLRRVLSDGSYVISLMGRGGTLARVSVVLDTNRSTLFDAAGKSLTAIGEMTSGLPPVHSGPAWLPSEDRALFTVSASDDLPAGLVEVGTDGTYTYLFKDPWYARANLVSGIPVSPDGRKALISADALYSVDLVTGDRQVLARGSVSSAAWSPDGEYLVANSMVIPRDGTVVPDLGEGSGLWAWSPDGESLTDGRVISRRDGSDSVPIAIPDVDQAFDVQALWRGDGQIYIEVRTDRYAVPKAFVYDPTSEVAAELSWLEQHLYPCGEGCLPIDTFWSPDGTKVMYGDWSTGSTVANGDGTSSLLLLDRRLDLSPHGSVGTFWSGAMVLRNLQNLVADLRTERLPGNDGLAIKGTASDRNLDHYVVEYALQGQPDAWHPIGTASSAPVVDDVLAIWTPQAPGTYLVRLTVADRAGNVRAKLAVVSWDLASPLANVTQNRSLISPNDDGVRDTVTFGYLVQVPMTLQVRIVGPGDAASAPTVRSVALQYPTVGTQAFTWDGRDDAGQVAPDGRYTALLGDLPLRVDVDATPPDIAFSLGNLRAVTVKERHVGSPAPVAVGAVVVDRNWHVADAHLKDWSGPYGSGADPVFAVATDANGQAIYSDGVPQMLLSGSRPADVKETVRVPFGGIPAGPFSADDHAGNASSLPVPLLEPRLFLLGIAPVRVSGEDREVLPPISSTEVQVLEASGTGFRVGSSFALTDPIRLQYQSKDGGAWHEVAADFARDGEAMAWGARLGSAGVPNGPTLRGRFATAGTAGDVFSESFLFTFCPVSLTARLLPAPPYLPGEWQLNVDSIQPLTSVRVRGVGKAWEDRTHKVVFDQTFDLDPLRPAPTTSFQRIVQARFCPIEMRFEVTAFDANGRVVSDSQCLVAGDSCSGLALEQGFAYCAGSPDALIADVDYRSTDPGTMTLQSVMGTPNPAQRAVPPAPNLPGSADGLIDVTGLGGGEFQATAVLTVGDQVSSAAAPFRIDRIPPSGTVMQPAEGELVCAQLDPVTGAGKLRIAAQVHDDGPGVQRDLAAYSVDGGSWQPVLKAKCESGGCESVDVDGEFLRYPPDDPHRIDAVDRPFALSLSVPALAEGSYGVRLPVCDRVGNRTTLERHFKVTTAPPSIQPTGLWPPVFSPNGDGLSDAATWTLKTLETLSFSVTIHSGGANGPLVRTLVSAKQFLPGMQALVWDGFTDKGQVAPEGSYAFVVLAEDACSRNSTISAQVELDNTPPTVAISQPSGGQSLNAGTDVLGTAADLHFAAYALSYGSGPAPTEWTVFRNGTSPVSASYLGNWVPPGVPGVYTLRLVARDAAQNQSESRVVVNVGAQEWIARVSATPQVFSPNGDGRADTTVIEYQLLVAGGVTLQILDGAGHVLRTVENQVQHAAGVYDLVWDGRADGGGAAPEGDLQALLLVSGPSGSGSQTQSTMVTLDRTAPSIQISEPAAGAYLTRSHSVHGSVSDLHLSSYAVAVAPVGGAASPIGQGTQSPADADLAPLSALADGTYTLSVTAQDTALNAATTQVSFAVDSTPPFVSLQFPAEGAVLGKGANPIDVLGTVSDANLQSYDLSYGVGPNPAVFSNVASGTAGGARIPVGPWSVAILPDGVYTLRLQATDRAGQVSEARVTVSLDSTPPAAIISAPAEGDSLSQGASILGTASDANLKSWVLQASPGPAATAFQFSTLKTGTMSVTAGPLFNWSPLPPDGVATLKLTVQDKAGHVATALRTITIDSGLPAAVTGLAATVVKVDSESADVQLRWNASASADVAGYRVFRDDALLTATLIPATTYTDPGRPTGTSSYSVTVVDRAGNVSSPVSIAVAIDLAQPIADILSPSPGAVLSGSVEIRGSAFKPTGFKGYKLVVGAGSTPTSWTIIQRSTVPVSAGILGSWIAVGSGPYVIALESEDVTGQTARASVTVSVDNSVPEPPLLTSLTPVSGAPSSLVATWQASPSTNVGGYLVYRNGRIANAPAIVLGDVRAYVVPGLSYTDAGLADGYMCYTVVAMSQAGNPSPPSNQLCQKLDNRAPQAFVTQPPSGARFEFPLQVAAQCADLDVSSVQFQWRPHDAASWSALGPASTQAPYQVPLDPAALHLSYGPYDLRAVATDQGGRTDPAPQAITVTYGSVNPPRAPEGLTAIADGSSVQLTWALETDPAVAQYQVSRAGTVIGTTPATLANFTDAGLSPGSWTYTVSAVDASGNVSPPSAPAGTLVYAITLDEPAFPVTRASQATLSGDGAQSGTTLEARGGARVIATAPATEGAFEVPAVPLVPGENLLAVQGVGASGERSILSNQVVLISDVPPAGVTGLSSSVADHDVTLTWNPSAAPNLYGYRVSRDGHPLTTSTLIGSADVQGAWASSQGGGKWAWNALDGDPSTAWVPFADDPQATWTTAFPAPVLIDKVSLAFVTGWGQPEAIPNYEIRASWQGQYVPLFKVSGNTEAQVTHELPQPFATDAIQIVVLSPNFHGIAEVQISHVNTVAAGTTTYLDAAVPDGVRHYGVSAVDVWGGESEVATLDVPVGDVTPPSAPSGLAAVVTGSAVALTWDANTEADLDGYIVLRDGVSIGTASGPSFEDAGLLQGTYSYTVLAVDKAGNTSDASDAASATVTVAPPPPPVPLLVGPTDTSHPLSIHTHQVDMTGVARRGTLVSLWLRGAVAGATIAKPQFSELASVAVPTGVGAAAIAPDGRTIAYTPADSFTGLTLQDVATGAAQSLSPSGYYGAQAPVFSPDGDRVAFVATSFVTGTRDLLVVDCPTGVVTPIHVGGEPPNEAAWSPDGASVAFTTTTGTTWSLSLFRFADSSTALVASTASGFYSAPRFAPDGTRIAFLVTDLATAKKALHVVSVADGAESEVDSGVSATPPAWSPDGQRILYTAGNRVRLFDFGSSEHSAVTDGTKPADYAAFDATGDWVTFVESAPASPVESLIAQDLVSSRRVSVATMPDPTPGWPVPPLIGEWLRDGRLVVSSEGTTRFYAGRDGMFELQALRLEPGPNSVTATSTDPASGVSSPASEPISITAVPEQFPDLAIAVGDLSLYPTIPTPGQPSQLSATVHNLGGGVAEDVAVLVALADASGDVLLQEMPTVSRVGPGETAVVSMNWTPPSAGVYSLWATANPEGSVSELRTDNNQATSILVVAPTGALMASVEGDRAQYPASAAVQVRVGLTNAGSPYQGTSMVTMEDASGESVAVLDTRWVSLEYGQSLEYTLTWNTASTIAGSYQVHLRALDALGSPVTESIHPFEITASLQASATLVPDHAAFTLGSSATFAAGVVNTTANGSLIGGVATLSLFARGTSTNPLFTLDTPLPDLLPGTSWSGTLTWPSAAPSGFYTAELRVGRGAEPALATAEAAISIAQPPTGTGSISGSLELTPGQVISGGSTSAAATITNPGLGLTAYPVEFAVLTGSSGTVVTRAAAPADLPSGRTTLTQSLSTAGLLPGPYVVLLRAGSPSVSLARVPLVVHGLIAPPSIDAPPTGSIVTTQHPILSVNDASIQGGGGLSYEFQLFLDAALSIPLPGANDIVEQPAITSWQVRSALNEGATYYWRARATDGFSASAWTTVASFTVATTPVAPTAPRPLAPASGSTISSLQPNLIVFNSSGLEVAPLSYEFRLAMDPAMNTVLASTSGVAEGQTTTSWQLPVPLQDGLTYYWSARSSDGSLFSPWSAAASFTIEAVAEPPAAPTLASPVGGVTVASNAPALVVENVPASKPGTLVYRFQLDAAPTFDSARLQASPDVAEGSSQTTWTPSTPLAENTVYYWRAAAFDGTHQGAWSVTGDFFVNVVNEAPGVPVPLSPGDDEIVTTPAPTLVVRNTTDPDRQPLTYEFRVTDAAGAIVASVAGVPEDPTGETSWTLPNALTEDKTYRWSVRASDGELAGGWSASVSFSLNAVHEPPSAPALVAPAEGSTVQTVQPPLTVSNATSPDGYSLTYTFEIYSVGSGGALTLVDQATGIPAGVSVTSWTPVVHLANGRFSWRARASDGVVSGAWMSSATFSVAVFVPPPAPTCLKAVPGDALVNLAWNASSDSTVIAYRVYRGTTRGGPYSVVASVAQPSFTDRGLANGTTYFYVVTAESADAESPFSVEVAATPVAPPPAVVTAEISFDPATVSWECLRSHHHGGGCGQCPAWLYARIELPRGMNPWAVDVRSVRLQSSVAADPSFKRLVPDEHHHHGESDLLVRFAFASVAPLLGRGREALTVTGTVATIRFQGTGFLLVGDDRDEAPVFPHAGLPPHCSKGPLWVRILLPVGVRREQMKSLRLNGVVESDMVQHEADLGDYEQVLVRFDRVAVGQSVSRSGTSRVWVEGRTLEDTRFLAPSRIRVRPVQ